MHPLDPQTVDILDRITDGFAVLDREFRVLFLNASSERRARRPREEMLGRSVFELFPDLAGTVVERSYRRAMEEQIPVEFELHYEPFDVWVSVSVYPSSSGLSIFSREVTAQKKAERALAESEARHRRIVETANEGIWMVDADYKTVWANERVAEMLAVSREELATRTVAELVYEEDRPELARQIAARKQGVAAQYDIRMKRGDGRVIWVLARISPILDADGKFSGALGMLTDITDRKRVELELDRQREWFRVTLASIGDAVIATDAQGRVTFMNRVAEDLTGWSERDARERPLDEVFVIVNEHTREKVESPVAKVLREGRVVGLANHTALIARDGTERPIDDSGAPIRDASGDMIGVVLVFRDNTERARAEAALRDADRRKDEFLAMLAHELRNPLAPIRTAVELMRASDGDVSRLAHARDVVERQTQHMTRLVDDLLDVSRITRGKIELRRESVDLSAVVARAVETIRPLVGRRNQRIAIDVPTEPLRAFVDPTRLAQVIGNLLHNASKFSADGARIELCVERIGDEAMVRVRDPGIGLSKESLGRIFEPFSQENAPLDRSQGGLGIGLTLVKRLVELHGGRVVVESEGNGRGSTFSVHLPLEAASPAATAPEPPARAAALRSLRILIVDDNVDAAQMLGELLTVLGHEVALLHDGIEVQERVRRTRPDVLLLDIGLPSISGYEVARRLRSDAATASVRLVALTGYGQQQDRDRSRDAGFDAHLVKPIDLELLRSTLAALFSER